MSGGFITKMRDWLQRLFGKKKPKEIETPASVAIELPEEVVSLDYFTQARHFLYKEGRPVGRPRSRRHSDIRCIQVNSFSDAYCFFLRLCDQRQIKFRQVAGYVHFELKHSDETVIFDLTDKIGGKPQGTLAVLKINKEETDIPMTEIEFVQPKITYKNENN